MAYSKRHKLDMILFVILACLILVGLIMLASASAVVSQEGFGNPYFFIKRQILYGLLPGIILGIVAFLLPYNFLKKISLPFFIFSIALLVLAFLPHFSFSSGGAKRWLAIGSFSFQPSEIAKLAFIIYLSAWLSGKEKEVKSFRFGIFPFLVTFGVLALLLFFQPDIGTLGVLTIIGISLLFLGGANLFHIFAIMISGTLAGWEMIKLAPYRLARFTTFLNPNADPFGISYQMNQALIAIGSGGILGLGLGQSRQKFNFLPESMNDSIFAIFAEEMGFIGITIVVIIFLLLIWRGCWIAKRAPDKFGKLLAAGIVSWFGGQAFINIAAISGLLPLTGIPLPFASYGGTNLAITLIASGILLNVSKYTV